jgi:hypothetical protein
VDATTQIITTVAGYGGTFTGDNVPATSTELNSPLGVTLDAQGNLYIADSGNYRVRRVDATTQIITTVAGDGTQGYSGDGKAAIDAELFIPQGLALDAAGNLYIADRDNYSVRGVDAATGIITTVAGNGTPGNAGNGGPAVDATLSEPVGLAMSSAGYLYIGDEENAQVRVLRPETLAATATTLSAAPLNVPAGQTLTLTATVTATAGTPTGTVTFLNGAATLGTGTLNSSGVATLALTPPQGVYSITASYAGTQLDLASVSSPPIAVTVNAIVTTTTLTANPTTLNVGQTLTLTATVAAASGAAPTGTVTFLNGTATLGTGTLNASGVATLVLTPAVGTYSITASYGGSSTDAASVSSPPITVTVNPAVTTTTLIATPTTLYAGRTLTLTATVTAGSGSTPTGTVTFLNGAASLGTGTLNAAGVAALVLTPPLGIYSITAAYGGTTDDAPSVSSPPITVNVDYPATATVLTASPDPSPVENNVTFTATVSSSAGTPTGTVSFYDGTVLLGTSTLESGVATYSTSALTVGSHNITAQYPGVAGFAASTSSVVVEVITPPAFSISASPASLSVYTGEAATYTVTVTPGTGFTLPAALTCTQLPANTTCTFTPATVTGGSGSSKLVVQTTAPSPATSASRGSRRYSVVALAGLLLLVIPRRWRRFRNRWLTLFALLAFMIAAPAVSGCGGPFTLAGGTPVGAQTITVNGTVSYESQTLTHTATVTLNVESLF